MLSFYPRSPVFTIQINMANVLAVGLKWPWEVLILIICFIQVLSGSVNAPVYTESAFISHVPESPHFIMFFAPWCSHCERLSPLWDKLANHLSKASLPVTVAKVDCTSDTHLCAQEDIKAYPTMRFFNYGNKATYRGSRDVSEFVQFSNKQLENHARSSETNDEIVMELDTYRFEKEVQQGLKIVNFYAPWCSHCQRLAPTWISIAEEFRYSTSVTILKLDCDKERMLCKKYEINGYPKIVTFFNGVQQERYKGDRSFESLKEFVDKMIKAYAAELNIDDGMPSVDESDELSQQTTDDYKSTGENHLEVINLGKDVFDMTIQSGKTFVYFFAPWCKYCKKFSPIWDELASTVLERGIMTKIAKVDCTKEEILCEELQISSYPSIVLFKSRFNFHRYDGNRDLESLLEFLKQNEHDEL